MEPLEVAELKREQFILGLEEKAPSENWEVEGSGFGEPLASLAW